MPAAAVPAAPSCPSMRRHQMQTRWDSRRCYSSIPISASRFRHMILEDSEEASGRVTRRLPPGGRAAPRIGTYLNRHGAPEPEGATALPWFPLAVVADRLRLFGGK